MRLRTRTLALESARYAQRWQLRTNPRLSGDPELPEWDWGRVRGVFPEPAFVRPAHQLGG